MHAAATSAWVAGFPAGFSGLNAHNVFAATLVACGDLDAAAKHVRYLGARVHEWPWIYIRRSSALIGELRVRGG